MCFLKTNPIDYSKHTLAIYWINFSTQPKITDEKSPRATWVKKKIKTFYVAIVAMTRVTKFMTVSQIEINDEINGNIIIKIKKISFLCYHS